jgi:hypothetical protein
MFPPFGDTGGDDNGESAPSTVINVTSRACHKRIKRVRVHPKPASVASAINFSSRQLRLCALGSWGDEVITAFYFLIWSTSCASRGRRRCFTMSVVHAS